MDELGTIALLLAATMALPYLVLRRDREKRRAAGKPHPWNPATFACAIGFFQLFSLPAYYWVGKARTKALLWLFAILGFSLAADRAIACQEPAAPAAPVSAS